MLDKTLSPSEHDLLEQLQEKLEMKLDHLPDGVMKHSILVGGCGPPVVHIIIDKSDRSESIIASI